MSIALVFAILIPLPSLAQASLAGAIVDVTSAYVAKASVELESGTGKYQVQTDDAGVFEFPNLPPGQYTLTIQAPGFKQRTIKNIGLLEQEKKRIPDVPLDVGLPCRDASRDLVLSPLGLSLGRLTGSVAPPAANVEVTLVCRTFTACGSTKTNSNGRFYFDKISAGFYGLNFHRDGYYPENATGYEYTVNAGWESVYDPKSLDECPNGNCDPKLRPKPPLAHCE